MQEINTGLKAVRALEPEQVIAVLFGGLNEMLRIVVGTANGYATRQIIFLAVHKRRVEPVEVIETDFGLIDDRRCDRGVPG